jgi:hypothetical protein
MMKTRNKKTAAARKLRKKLLTSIMIDHETNGAKIAEQMGTVRSAIAHFVNGDTNSRAIAEAFAHLSGFTIDEILAGERKYSQG